MPNSHLPEYTNIGLIHIDLNAITVNNVQRVDNTHVIHPDLCIFKFQIILITQILYF